MVRMPTVRLALFALGIGTFAAGVVRRARWKRRSPGTVVITGGSRGLGLALAHEYLDRGARVAICARDEAELERARRDLEAEAVCGGRVVALPCDVTQRAQVEAMLTHVRQRLGPIDMLVNNAGQIVVGPSEHMTLEDFRNALDVHVYGPLHTTLAVLPEMRARGSGRIVNISSIGGRLPVPHLLPYCVSKAALTALSEGLRAELERDGISVTTVSPGLMRTGSPRHAIFKGQHQLEYAWFGASAATPLISTQVERAARKIVAASLMGRADLVISPQAVLGAAFHGVFPGLTARLFAWVDRLLPRPGGIGSNGVAGRDTKPRWFPKWLRRLNDQVAERYNQFDPTTERAGHTLH